MKLSFNQTLSAMLLLVIAVIACNKFGKAEPKSGSEFLLKAECKADCNALIEQTIRILEVRADAMGISYKAERKGTDEIIFRIGAIQDPERVKKVLFSNDRMELRAVVSPPSPSPFQTYASLEEAKAVAKEGEEVLPYVERGEEKKYVIVKAQPIISNEDVRDAQAVSRTGSDNDYQITFSLKPEGAKRFGEWTGANINQYLAVTLNKEVKSVAYIKSQITDSGEISGSFTKASAEDLALVLRSGSLPTTIKLLEEKTFGK